MPRRRRSFVFASVFLAAALLVSSRAWPTCRDYNDLWHVAGACVANHSIGLAVEGTLAFVDGAYINEDIKVIDISDPNHPAVIGHGGTPGAELCVSGSYLYEGLDGGITIWNVSVPGTLTEEGHLHGMSSQCRTPALSGTVLCCVDRFGGGGLLLFDVSTVSAPSLITRLGLPGAIALKVRGNFAYVGAGTRGLYIIDISSPLVPVLVATADTPGAAGDVAIDGIFAYVADGDGVQAVDISNPHVPLLRGRCAMTGPGTLAVQNNVAYVTTTAGELRAVDVSDPDHPLLANIVGTAGPYPGGVNSIAVSGGYIYVSTGSYFDIISTAHALEPSPSGPPLALPDSARGIACQDGYAYVADDDVGGLTVIDVSSSAQPVIVGGYDTPRTAYAVAMYGRYACVADGRSGIAMIDVSNPSAPFVAGREDRIDPAMTIGCADRCAYVSDNTNQLRVVDISDPAHPTLIRSLTATSAGNDIRDYLVEGDRLYVAAGSYGLIIYDITDETNPVQLGRFDTPGGVNGVAGSTPYIFLADGDRGLCVIDVFNPAAPVQVASLGAPEVLRDLARDGTRLFAAAGTAGIQVFDVSNPLAPVLLGSHVGVSSAVSCAFWGDRLFAVTTAGQLLTFPRDCFADPTRTSVGTPDVPRPSIATSSPNPFSRGTELRFLMPASGSPRLTILDVRGRAVRDLSADVVLTEGAERAWWDGRNDSGAPSAPGVYFARLQSGANATTARLLLLR